MSICATNLVPLPPTPEITMGLFRSISLPEMIPYAVSSVRRTRLVLHVGDDLGHERLVDERIDGDGRAPEGSG